MQRIAENKNLTEKTSNEEGKEPTILIEEADYEFSLNDALSQPFMTGKMPNKELVRRIKDLRAKRNNLALLNSEKRELVRLV